MKPILAGMIAIASIASAVSGAQAQSFNCRRAYFADEKLICMSPDLSRLDERLDRVFGQTRNQLSPAGRSALDREEERWVVGRRRCGPDHRCIEDFYRDRIGELAGRLDDVRGDVRGEARRGDRDNGWRDDGGEPPVARRERQREIPPSERVAPEPPRMEPRRERPVAAEPIERDRIEHSTAQREAPASSPSRQSSREQRTDREETASRTEQTAARRPPPPTNGKRQPAPVQAESASQPAGFAASTAPQHSSRRQTTARSANTAPPPEAGSGSGMPRPRIEFADPASGPMSPAR